MRMYKHLILLSLIALNASAFATLEMAITVDDLPIHSEKPKTEKRREIGRKLLTVLKAHHVPQVYGFINAGQVEGKKELYGVLQDWAATYPLGNHTYKHVSLSKSTAKEFIEAIEQNEPTLNKLSPAHFKYFRYPFLEEGDTLDKREDVRRYLKGRGYQIAQVSVDFSDWAWNDAYARCSDKGDAKQIKILEDSFLKAAVDWFNHARRMSDIVFKRDIKYVLLMHIGAFEPRMMDRMLTAYEKMGIKFIPLSDALADKAYEDDPEYVSGDGATFLEQHMIAKDLKMPKVPFSPLKQLEKTCL